MGKKSKYYCCICGKSMERNNRLVHQEYDRKEVYGNFHNVANYDICDKCFKIFINWIKKHRKEN